MAIFSEAVGLVNEVVTIFKPKEPTPEEQRKKAGTWYLVLQDFLLNDPTPAKLADDWTGQLPFAQKSTKVRFMSDHIRNNTPDNIVNVLVGKINDELVKGGFRRTPKADILEGMGVGDAVGSSPSGLAVVSASTVPTLGPTDEPNDKEVNESQKYFFALGILIIIVGVFTWLFWKPKKR